MKEIDYSEYTERQLLEFQTDSLINSERYLDRIFRWVRFFGILILLGLLGILFTV